MLDSTTGLVGLAALAVVTVFALWRGDRGVRIGALLYAATWLAVGFAQNRKHLGGPQWGVLCADTIGALALFALAIGERRPWAAATAAFQLLGVATDVAFVLDLRILHVASVTASYVWGYAALAAIAIGAAISEHRAKVL